MILRSQVAYYQGQYKKAGDLATKLLMDARKHNNHLHEAWALAAQAQNLLRLGQVDEVIALYAETQQLLAMNTDLTSEMVVYGFLATCHLRRGDLDWARKNADINLGLMAGMRAPTSFDLIEAFSGVSEVYLDLWEQGETWAKPHFQKSSKRALHLLRRYARIFAIGQPRTFLWRGLYEWLKGKKQKAIRFWQKGADLGQEMRMPYERAMCFYEIGRHICGEQ